MPLAGSIDVLKKWQSSRKSTFVNGRIQGRILGRIAAYWFLYHFVLWNGLFLYRYAQYRTAVGGGGEVLTFRQLYGQFCFDFYPLLVCAVAILPVFLWDFVKMTHRIAGPLMAFQNALRDLRAGRRVERVETRQHDMLNEFQEEFNEFLNYYNARVDAVDARTTGRMTEADALAVDEIAGEASSSQHDELAKTAIMID